MLGNNIFENRINSLVHDIAMAHSRCNHHAKHMFLNDLCTYMKRAYQFLKRKYEQKNIDELDKCYFHIQYFDNIIKRIYSILDDDVIQEYELYKDSVRRTIDTLMA